MRRNNPNKPFLYATQEEAAIVIQSFFRGYRVRKFTETVRLVVQLEIERISTATKLRLAAICIQRHYRGHRVRVYLGMGKLMNGLPVVDRW